jgi:LIVCS family branched-chain amino acid:cation transporter
MVALACLTTAIGLTSSAGAYIEKLSNNKISYKAVVTAVCLFSAVISTMGVEAIVKYAALVLSLLYAPILTLIVLSLVVE